jgi:hypothetical protein
MTTFPGEGEGEVKESAWRNNLGRHFTALTMIPRFNTIPNARMCDSTRIY